MDWESESFDPKDPKRRFLDALLRVELSDGRVIEGALACYDKFCNLVLRDSAIVDVSKDASAATSLFGDDRKRLGSVMIPGEHIVKVSSTSTFGATK